MPNDQTTATTLPLANGCSLRVEDWMEVRCDTHGVVTTWGALDPIQQLAVEEGIDTADDLPCLLAPRKEQP